MGVSVGVSVGMGVLVGVSVGIGVLVGDSIGVSVAVGVNVGVSVGVGDRVGVGVGVETARFNWIFLVTDVSWELYRVMRKVISPGSTSYKSHSWIFDTVRTGTPTRSTSGVQLSGSAPRP